MNNSQKGFSLIEMIVSLGIFSVVATTAIGSLLVVISTNKQLQAEQSVMTNLAFVVDSMTREIRTGSGYVCVSANNTNQNIVGFGKIFKDDENDHDNINDGANQDCSVASTQNFVGLSFAEGGNSITGNADRIMYYYDKDAKKIMRRVGNAEARSIVSSGLEITKANFFVTGSEELSENNTNTEQPTFTIYLEAKDVTDTNGKVYSMQTTVTQRTLDI